MPLSLDTFNLNSLHLELLQNINISPALLLASSAVAVPLLYSFAAGVVEDRLPKLTNKRICLLIAHPDDEAMFYAPTMLGLTQPDSGNHVKILCLSAGNADGLGETRKKELVKSGLALGLKDGDDVFVMDSLDFPDSMTTKWDENKIASLLCSAFAPQLAQQRAKDVPQPTANIDVLITFDRSGVSSHPNHISLYHGARAFRRALTMGKPEWESPVDVYTLGTVNVLRKYSGCLDIFTTLAGWLGGGGGGGGARHAGEGKNKPGALIFTNQLVGAGPRISTAWGAMTQAHKSQMVWFRYLWLGFSRYMLINDLRLETTDE